MVTLYELRKDLEKKKADNIEENLIDLHEGFMQEYGWISVEEFGEIPIPTLLNLLDRINKRHEKEKEDYDKMKAKMPSRRK